MTELSLFWLLAGGMTLLALVLLVVPMLRTPRRALVRAEYDLAIYRDQLRELEEEIEQGAILPEAAERARNEIAHRILAADAARRKAQAQLAAGGRGSAMLAVVTAVAAAGMAVMLYLQVGQPGRPDLPLEQRLANAMRNNDLAAMVRRAEQKLRENPDDLRGWLALAPIYEQLGQPQKAVEAWRNVIRLTKKPSAELYNAYGEALVRLSRGQVTKEAVKAFSKAQELEPGDPMSRYYLAIADLQAGRLEAAYDRLNKLLADLSPDVPARATIARQVAQLAQRLGRKPPAAASTAPASQPASSTSGRLAQSATGAAGASSRESGPSREEVRKRMQAMRNMSPEKRMAMIRNMVEGLDQRLKDNPDDLPGWLRLIRARVVLGEREKAASALQGARKAFAGKPDALAQLNALAARLGLAE